MENPIAYSYLRFSTPDQSEGDSFRRQYEATKQYCITNNLNLSEDNFHDKGISAFRGKNKNDGAQLKRFLDLCKSGQIKPGSYFICEHADRISRENILNAFATITEILNLGILIVTLSDGKVYSKENCNGFSVMPLLFSLFQSNEESAKKQERIHAVWENKRKNLISGNNVKLSQIPHWLEKSKDHSIIENKVKCETVKRIFDLYLNRKNGVNQIHRVLNQENVPLISKKKKSNRWNSSYIKKILTNQAVTGYSDLFEIKVDSNGNRKRVKVTSNPIKIYPEIISIEDFENTKIKLRSNSKHNKGRVGFINLFPPSIVICARCNGRMVALTKSKDEKWFKCKNYLDRKGCKNKCGYPYNEFENAFFKNVKEIDFNQLNDEKNDSIKYLEKTIESKRIEVQGCDLSIKENVDLLIQLKGVAKNSLVNKINEIEEKREILFNQIVDLTNELSVLKSNQQGPKNFIDLILSVSKHSNNIEREKLKQIIVDNVEKIIVYSYRNIDDFAGFSDEEWNRFIRKCRFNSENIYFKKLRAFRIKYKFLKQTRLVRGIPKYYAQESILTNFDVEKF